jgi:predicted AAA+ superfamily ATPase
MQRDVQELARIEGVTDLPRLLALLAARTCSLANHAELSRSSGLPQTTLKRYLALLETTFVLQPLPAWSANLSRRLTKSPKLLLSDTGLAAHLLNVQEPAALAGHAMFGPLLESFVALELRKQATWCETLVRLYHFRTAAGQEVDLLLERQDGAIVGIAVKAAASVGADDFKVLRLLREGLGGRFRAGLVLHLGRQTVPYGDRLWAVPVGALWA